MCGGGSWYLFFEKWSVGLITITVAVGCVQSLVWIFKSITPVQPQQLLAWVKSRGAGGRADPGTVWRVNPQLSKEQAELCKWGWMRSMEKKRDLFEVRVRCFGLGLLGKRGEANKSLWVNDKQEYQQWKELSDSAIYTCVHCSGRGVSYIEISFSRQQSSAFEYWARERMKACDVIWHNMGIKNY